MKLDEDYADRDIHLANLLKKIGIHKQFAVPCVVCCHYDGKTDELIQYIENIDDTITESMLQNWAVRNGLWPSYEESLRINGIE